MGSAQYDQRFFDYVNEGAIRSARAILPLLTDLKIGSVLDVGCGQGAWLSVWSELGVRDFKGIDGPYVDVDRLKIPNEHFITADLRKSFDLGRRFDLTQCLEVAEHLPESSARSLVSSLTRHADQVLFSAAAKGQGGENHINEQPYDYWRQLFAENGFVACDSIRPKILSDQSIEPWYRYNTFLYIHRKKVPEIPRSHATGLTATGTMLQDLSPPAYRVRKTIIRFLPTFIVSALSRFRIALLMKRKRPPAPE
jgi:SAM-dependent methyltransferase